MEISISRGRLLGTMVTATATLFGEPYMVAEYYDPRLTDEQLVERFRPIALKAFEKREEAGP